MCDINSDFVNELSEYIFGDEFTKQDQRNLLRNINPAYEGTGILKFGTILNSQHFMEFVITLWETKQNLYETRRRYKKNLKTDKDYNLVCDLLNKEREDCQIKISEMREKYESLEKENINNNPMYKKLEHDYKRLYHKYVELDHKLENQEKIKEELTNAMIEKSEIELKFKEFYQDKYKKDVKINKTEYDKKIKENEQELDKFKKEFVKQQDKIIFMEKNNELKLVKEELKKVKNQNVKFKKQLIESMD